MGNKKDLFWQTGCDNWPVIGGKYLITIDGIFQHETYEFDQGDDGNGGGEYFWSRDDCDECPRFNPESDMWLRVDTLTAAPQPVSKVPDALDISVLPTEEVQYATGWNDCRRAVLKAAPQPVGESEWKAGAPPLDEHALMHIPLRGYPDYMAYGFVSENGTILDCCGDDIGWTVDAVVSHMAVHLPQKGDQE